jgi:hypothetical protein
MQTSTQTSVSTYADINADISFNVCRHQRRHQFQRMQTSTQTHLFNIILTVKYFSYKCRTRLGMRDLFFAHWWQKKVSRPKRSARTLTIFRNLQHNTRALALAKYKKKMRASRTLVQFPPPGGVRGGGEVQSTGTRLIILVQSFRGGYLLQYP